MIDKERKIDLGSAYVAEQAAKERAAAPPDRTDGYSRYEFDPQDQSGEWNSGVMGGEPNPGSTYYVRENTVAAAKGQHVRPDTILHLEALPEGEYTCVSVQNQVVVLNSRNNTYSLKYSGSDRNIEFSRQGGFQSDGSRRTSGALRGNQ